MPRHRPQSIAKTFSDAKAEYAGMTENRFRRRRPGVNGVGASGDAHYQDAESRFIRMREYTRAMVRDDGCAKFLVGRAVDNIIGPGFRYEPDTGDDKLDLDLWQRQEEWAKDPQACDVAGERTFAEIERQTAFSEFVDGDVFIAGTEGGQLQVFEADRCATPKKSMRTIIYGVELDATCITGRKATASRWAGSRRPSSLTCRSRTVRRAARRQEGTAARARSLRRTADALLIRRIS